MTESEHVKLGAYHTLELEPGRSFNLHKALWDSLDIERIRTATDPQASADLAALLITVSPMFCLVKLKTRLFFLCRTRLFFLCSSLLITVRTSSTVN
jgi:hypothetical protein